MQGGSCPFLTYYLIYIKTYNKFEFRLKMVKFLQQLTKQMGWLFFTMILKNTIHLSC